jgi:hypothetical protein
MTATAGRPESEPRIIAGSGGGFEWPVIQHELTAADGAAMAFLRVWLAANPAPIARASSDGLFEQVRPVNIRKENDP